MLATVALRAIELKLDGKPRIPVGEPPEQKRELEREKHRYPRGRQRIHRTGKILASKKYRAVRVLFFVGPVTLLVYGLKVALALDHAVIAFSGKRRIPGRQPLQQEHDPDIEEVLSPQSRQLISKSGRILVSKKAWVVRVIFLVGLVTFMGYGLRVALAVGDALIAYSVFILVHSSLYPIYGWFVFKTKARGKVPNNLVSIIVPVYNQEKLIEKVVKAVYCSTYNNIEVVVVDDGSKDTTGKLLDELAMKNPKLKIIHKTNGGKRTAVAAGFYVAKGDFIVLIDSDSIVDKYAIEELMKTFSANPRVGGIVGNGKPLNADKNVLTRCQDVWYDNTFNIHKAAESSFGTVLCLSGCLAAYRREAISRFIPYWAEDKTQYSDDRTLTTYTIANSWAKTRFAPVERRLMEEAAAYDDAEDRALTSQTLKEWETAYAPTAIVYTEVPEGFKQYIRQQIRWKKGYLRTNFFASSFFWRKNPIMALIFYTEFMSSFLMPAIAFSIFFYRPMFLQPYWSLLAFIGGQMLVGLIFGLDYKFRDPSTKNWLYKPLMNLISIGILSWVLLVALWGLSQNKWLTR
jgi:hyaluronan synthase